MSNFKVGQKVVFVGGVPPEDDGIILPKINEIVTINYQSLAEPDYYGLVEYPYGIVVGGLASQVFHKDELRALYSIPRSEALSELLSKEITIERSDVQPTEVEVQQ